MSAKDDCLFQRESFLPRSFQSWVEDDVSTVSARGAPKDESPLELLSYLLKSKWSFASNLEKVLDNLNFLVFLLA